MSSSFRRGARTRISKSVEGEAFPKPGVGLGLTGSSTTSPAAVFERIGTKPWIGGLTLTSSGLRELDAIFGGGQPLGTLILMEEDRWTQDLTLALVRYWAAEALAQGQTLGLVSTMQNVDTLDLDSIGHCNDVRFQQGMSPRGIQAFLNMIPRDQHLDKSRAKSNVMEQKIELAKAQATVSSLTGFGTIEEGEDFEEEEEETAEGTDAGLTNAWQYKVSVQRERMGVSVSAPMSSKCNQGKIFCHSFDLGGKMVDQHDANWIRDENETRLCYFRESCPRCPAFACCQTRSCAMAFYNSCVKQIGDEIAKHPNTVIRILIMNAAVQTTAIALPLLLSYIREHALPVVFLATVRPWLRPPYSSPGTTMSYTRALISLKRTSDAVLTCEGFSAMTLPPPPEFSDLAGILTIRKLALQSLSHFADTTTNRRPPANRYGMKRDRRKMHIRMLHLPPEDFSAGGSSVSGGVRSGAGKVKEKDTSSTALQPGMGCSSNQSSRKGSSTTPSLDF